MTRTKHNDVGCDGGFTLLEVMASVVIIGVAMAAIMTDRNQTVQRVGITNNMRRATMLAQQKINEITLGLETALSGSFEGQEAFSWKVVEDAGEPLDEQSQPVPAGMISVSVTYPSGSGQGEVTLTAPAAGGQN
jgi:prepilin-type N-terminal cleavage/methylation domain-containing protein